MKKTRKLQKKTLKLKKIDHTSEVPASQGQLEAVRSELKSDILSLGLRMDGFESRMDSFESRMDGFSARMDSFSSRMDSFSSRIDSLEAKMESSAQRVESSVQRVVALVEEQNARNNWVIDAYKIMVDVQEDLRTRTGRLEVKVFGAEGS